MVSGRQIAQIEYHDIDAVRDRFQEFVMRATLAADIAVGQLFFQKPLFRPFNGTGLYIKGIEDGIGRHEFCQKSRIISVPTGHIDNHSGPVDIGIEEHVRYRNGIAEWIHINHFPSSW